jgi:NADP-dependent 3-hydroxy acid dehydrogenase YdfG
MKAMISNEIIWITGASTGIGRELAIKLAAQGNKVLASARGEQGLAALAQENPGIIAIPFDVTDKSQLDKVAASIGQHVEYIDRVILNAGNCEYFDLSSPDWAMMERVMDVNYFGAINSLQIALPLLRLCPSFAHIVGVASLAAEVPFPRAQAYGASKAAIEYFLNALRVDIAQENIDVTVIKPGFVSTPLTDKNDFDMPFLMSADEASDRMISAITRRPDTFSFPRRLSGLLFFFRLFPGLWNRWVAPKLVNH